MFRRTVVEDVPVETRATRYEDVVDREEMIDPNRIIDLLAGLGLLLLGVLVLIDTGFSGFPSTPVTEVAGFTQTPLLGVIDVGFGLFLLAAAADWTRGISIFTGALMLAGGIVELSADDRLATSLRADHGYGWMAVVVGAIVLVAALVLPAARFRHHEVRSRGVAQSS
jgi:uncharacterized membrane protein HdeD (DUF308 family)